MRRAPRRAGEPRCRFQLQVVTQVEVIDQISLGKITTEYRYHGGYWDGVEREFRGFSCVEQLDTESFETYAKAGLHGADTAFAAVDRQYFSPPVLTKTWFHQGAVGDDAVEFRELDYRHEFWVGDAQQLDHVEGVNQLLAQLRRKYASLTSRERRQIEREAPGSSRCAAASCERKSTGSMAAFGKIARILLLNKRMGFARRTLPAGLRRGIGSFFLTPSRNERHSGSVAMIR